VSGFVVNAGPVQQGKGWSSCLLNWFVHPTWCCGCWKVHVYVNVLIALQPPSMILWTVMDCVIPMQIFKVGLKQLNASMALVCCNRSSWTRLQYGACQLVALALKTCFKGLAWSCCNRFWYLNVVPSNEHDCKLTWAYLYFCRLIWMICNLANPWPFPDQFVEADVL
jgi:hypothetical protein